jgi:SAM-dependent methyltransferase
MKLDYSSQYYDQLSEGSSKSAAAIVPVVMEYVAPRSVVDLGCGTGVWLAEFKRQGVSDVLGVDGTHIAAAQLAIHPENFLAADLSQPLRLVGGQFDLAMSLEVAEHLNPRVAGQLIDSLTRLAPVVLFSAAIPDQGGEHHINEQWPAYWEKLFHAKEFVALDPFRRFLWARTDVDWWYAQNIMLFIRQDELWRFPNLTSMVEPGFNAYVHPRNYARQTWRNRAFHVAVDIAATTQKGDVVILVDGDQFGSLYLPERVLHPFVERDGKYFGPPSDGAHAVSELIRMRKEGADYIAFGWPAFWWLTHYGELSNYLEQNCSLIQRNDHLILYRLTP